MNVVEAIFSRRAARAFLPAAVEDAVIHSLLRAAVQAPSAMNAQPWLFAIIQNKAQLQRYSDRAKSMLLEYGSNDPKTRHYAESLKSPAFNIFYDASNVIAIGVAEQTKFAQADCWLAAENLMLAATEAGLGTCCVGFALPVLNRPEVKLELGFPETGAIIAPILVGHCEKIPEPILRRDPKIAGWSR